MFDIYFIDLFLNKKKKISLHYICEIFFKSDIHISSHRAASTNIYLYITCIMEQRSGKTHLSTLRKSEEAQHVMPAAHQGADSSEVMILLSIAQAICSTGKYSWLAKFVNSCRSRVTVSFSYNKI